MKPILVFLLSVFLFACQSTPKVKMGVSFAATDTIKVSTADEFKAAIAGTKRAVVVVTKNINTGYVQWGSNKTVVSLSGKDTLFGDQRIEYQVNDTIENLFITNDFYSDWDGICIKGSKHCVVRYCTIFDCADGAVDMNYGADSNKVEYCKFFYTKPWEHALVNLVGSGDDHGATDRGKLTSWFDHNWYGAHCYDRMPRVRFGKVRVINCLFDGIAPPDNKVSYYITFDIESEVLSQANYFKSGISSDPFRRYDNTGKCKSVGDYFAMSGVEIPNDNISFSYTGPIDPVEDVSAIVMAKAGAGNMPITSPIPPEPPIVIPPPVVGDFDTTIITKVDTIPQPDKIISRIVYDTVKVPPVYDTTYIVVVKPKPKPPTASQITSFELFNANTDASLGILTNGQAIKIGKNKYTVIANTTTEITSVQFALSGSQSLNYTDSRNPFALQGDDGNGNYYYGSFTPAAGSTYKLIATPYVGTVAGKAETINFSFVR